MTILETERNYARLIAWSAALALVTVGCGTPAPAMMPGDDAGEEVDGGTVETPDEGVIIDPVDLGGEVVQTPPTLTTVLARQVGRFGDDVRIDVVGGDANGDASSLDVTFLDAAGAELPLYDVDGDGVSESGNTLAPLATPIAGTADAPAYVLFTRLHGAHPEIASVRVALVDARDLRSAPMTAPVGDQPILALDALCDVASLENRCADGLGCRGDVPTVCVAGAAPAIVRAAYLTSPAGALVLVEGTDADDDLSQLEISFFDAAGGAIQLDLDADGTPESTSFAADARDTSAGGRFFYRFSASAYFAATVPRVAVVARDRGDQVSPSVIADLGAPVSRSIGQMCDARGFDSCGPAICAPGIVGEMNRCIEVTAARAAACTSAATLDLATGAATVRGDLHDPSLWDAPDGCSSGDPKARPEAAVRFTLAAPASRVVISTDNAYTNFDSALYAFAGCAGRPIVAWCADDRAPSEARAWLATLELRDLPAGEYFVVVDSFAAAPGRFQLDVTVTP